MTEDEEKYLIPITRCIFKQGWSVDYQKDANCFVDATSYIKPIVEKAKQQAREEFAREIKEKCFKNDLGLLCIHEKDLDKLLQGGKV